MNGRLELPNIIRWISVIFLALLSILTFLLAWGFSESLLGAVTPPNDGGIPEFIVIWAIIIFPWIAIYFLLKRPRTRG